MWYLIVSIPDLCNLTYFVHKSSDLIVTVDVNSTGTGSSPVISYLLISGVSGNTVLLQRSSTIIRPISWRLVSGIVTITFGDGMGITVVS